MITQFAREKIDFTNENSNTLLVIWLKFQSNHNITSNAFPFQPRQSRSNFIGICSSYIMTRSIVIPILTPHFLHVYNIGIPFFSTATATGKSRSKTVLGFGWHYNSAAHKSLQSFLWQDSLYQTAWLWRWIAKFTESLFDRHFLVDSGSFQIWNDCCFDLSIMYAIRL